jgi:hypothetical protein
MEPDPEKIGRGLTTLLQSFHTSTLEHPLEPHLQLILLSGIL